MIDSDAEYICLGVTAGDVDHQKRETNEATKSLHYVTWNVQNKIIYFFRLRLWNLRKIFCRDAKSRALWVFAIGCLDDRFVYIYIARVRKRNTIIEKADGIEMRCDE